MRLSFPCLLAACLLFGTHVRAEDRSEGLLPSDAAVARLSEQPTSITKETVPGEAREDRSTVQASVFGAWTRDRGPWLGVSVGMFRAFRLDLGVTQDVLFQRVCRATKCSDRPTQTLGFTPTAALTAAIVSYNGLEFSGGVLWAGSFGLQGRLAVPLDPIWLPLRVPGLRLFLQYPIGGGLEWGRP